MDTQDELRVSGVGLSLQRSDEDVDQSQPQREKGNRLVVGPSILLVKFALQQNLKHKVDSLEIGFLSFVSHTHTHRQTPRHQRRYLGLDVAKVMRQRQHRKQDVDGSSSQVRWVNIHLEFGKFPGRLTQRRKCSPGNKDPSGKPPEEVHCIASKHKPVWYNCLQSSDEVGHHHIDPLQVSAKQGGRVEDDGG